MTTGRQRALLYARKSMKTDSTEEQSASVTDQLERCRAYAVEHGWDIVGEHADDGRSGLLDRDRRPGLNAALKSLEGGHADVLVTLWTSRLSREERQRAEILEILDLLKVEWHAVADGGLIDRSTYAGYITYGVHTIFDVAYSKRIGENWIRTHQRRLDAGLPKTTSPRFGYLYDADTKKHVVQPDAAAAVKDLYRRYTRGEGFTPLVAWLNSEGWTVAGSGGPWTVRTLSRFMDSGFAAGLISREADLRDLRGAHEPLLSEPEWLAYRAERDARRSMARKSSGASARWWLAGLVKCAHCGSALYIDSFTRVGSSALCTGHRGNPASCPGVTILRAYVENAVGLWLGGHLDQLDALTEVESGSAANEAAIAYQAAVAVRDKVVDGLADLEVAKALGDMQPVVYQRARQKLDGRLAVAEQAVKAAAAALATPEVDAAAVRRGLESGWTADETAALRGVLARVEVGQDDLTIYPASGDPVVRSRASLKPGCNVSGCDRVHYTRGLCKSHVMLARNIGGEDLLNVLSARAEESIVTVDAVHALFAN
ncbi:MAG: recombinase family protein [Actinobacteria bacterium]|nr:recombinase family protein [Actinomycetota bacterium]